MEGSALMKWGVICSIQNEEQISEFIECSRWLVRKLEESAARLHFGHRFTENPSFALHASPGSEECAKAVYAKIVETYPGVCYILHILPSKDSIEYHMLKKMSINGALIAQGVLADNALNKFDCYNLDEVFENMNQWIGRRLAQITARRTEEEAQLAKQIKELVTQISNSHKFPPNQAKQSTSSSYRKDNYQLVINNSNYGRGSRFKITGANAVPLMECRPPQPASSYDGATRSTTISSGGWKTITEDPIAPNVFDVPTGIVLHTQSDSSSHHRYRAQRLADNEGELSASAQQLDMAEREKEVIIKGYPLHFNKYQIASLFTDFRPLNVQYIVTGEALVQFANKFHAAQIIANYNGCRYEDEGFQLETRPAYEDAFMKHISTMKTKMAVMMLKVTTKKAANNKESVEVTAAANVNGKKGQPTINGVDSTTKTVAKDLANQIKERILKMTDQNQQQN